MQDAQWTNAAAFPTGPVRCVAVRNDAAVRLAPGKFRQARPSEPVRTGLQLSTRWRARDSGETELGPVCVSPIGGFQGDCLRQFRKEVGRLGPWGHSLSTDGCHTDTWTLPEVLELTRQAMQVGAKNGAGNHRIQHIAQEDPAPSLRGSSPRW